MVATQKNTEGQELSFQVSSGKNYIFHFLIFPDMLKVMEVTLKVHFAQVGENAWKLSA